MRAIDADALQLAIVEEGQANKRKKYIIGDIWELTGAEIREVINSQPTIQPEIIRCKDCKYWIPYDWMFSEVWRSKNMADYVHSDAHSVDGAIRHQHHILQAWNERKDDQRDSV